MGSNIFVSLGEWRERIDSAAFALANNNNYTITCHERERDKKESLTKEIKRERRERELNYYNFNNGSINK